MLIKVAQPKPLETSHDGLVWQCAREMERRGLTWRSLARAQGLTPGAQPDPTARIFARSEQAFLREAGRIVGDPLFGWSLGDWELRDMGLYGYSVLNAPDLRSALDKMVRLSATISEAAHLDVRVTNGQAVLAQGHSANTVTSAMCLRIFLCHMHELVGPDFKPTRIGLFSSDQDQLHRLSDRIGTAVEGFAAPVTFLTFPASLLDRPIHGADARLAEVLERLWNDECATLAARTAEMAELQRAVVALLPTGRATPSRVALALGISLRGLAVKLDRVGATLPAIVDTVRAGLVAPLLARPNMTLLGAAQALGFSDPDELARAHQRWWGTAPQDGRGRWLH